MLLLIFIGRYLNEELGLFQYIHVTINPRKRFAQFIIGYWFQYIHVTINPKPVRDNYVYLNGFNTSMLLLIFFRRMSWKG